MNNSAGVLPFGEFGLGVDLYTSKNVWSAVVGVFSPSAFLRTSFNVSTNLSACLLKLGWKRTVLVCYIALSLHQF